jgi:heptosyltransferase-2
MPSLFLWLMIPTWLAIVWRRYLTKTPRTAKGPGHPRNIIVFRLDQLGDLVLTTPLFRELRRMYPGVHCTAVVQGQHKAILTTNRNIDEILPLSEVNTRWVPKRARLLFSALALYWTELRHRDFDLAISPRWDVDESLAAMLCALTNAKTRVGYSASVSSAKRRINYRFDAAFDVIVPPSPPQHEVDRNLAIIEALGGNVENRRLQICLTENDRTFARDLLLHHDRRRVLVAIGIGGRAKGRKWPLRNYAECIARLDGHRLVQPVIVCSGDEDTEASELSMMLEVPPYILSGVPLRTVCAVLERCDLFVGNDTGTAHLAAAMDCPTVVVSRHPLNGHPDHPNSPARFAPSCSRYRVVQPLSRGGECIGSCQVTEPHCIKRVTVERVVAAAVQLLPDRICAEVSMRPVPLEVLHFAEELSPVGAAGLS